VLLREHGGNSVPAVFSSESRAAAFISARIAMGTTVHADEAHAWDHLHERFEVKRINHQEAHSLDGACTNQTEEFFSHLRRAEIGIYHHIAGAYLLRYAPESSWREDNRRVSNGDQVNRIAHLAMKRGKSVDFTGYWQRHIADGSGRWIIGNLTQNVYGYILPIGGQIMVVAEISVGLTSLRAALDITKAMVGLRDAEAFRAKSIEVQGLILESLGKAIEAREAYSTQLDRVRALETEVADLKNWGAEKQDYELKPIGEGSVAYMLKPDKRGAEPPHWLCPNCYSKGKKSFLNPTGANVGRGWIHKCIGCGAQPACGHSPSWQDE